MARRSISLLPAMERQVRNFQAELLTFLDRDVTFTEALNLYILGGVMGAPAKEIKALGKESINGLLDGLSGSRWEALLDPVMDEVSKRQLKQAIANPTASPK